MRKPLFVSFSGSHSVGKTTLLSEVAGMLRKEGFSVVCIEESARKVSRSLHGSFEGQKLMLELLKKDLLSARMKDVDFVLTDRAPIDMAYYSLFFACKGWNVEEIRKARDLVKNAFELTSKYIDVLFYIDGVDVVPVVDDGFRFVDQHSRYSVDLVAKSLLALGDRFKIIHIKPRSIEETALEIVNYLKGMV